MNRCPTLVVKYVTPEEAWSGVKPTVEHFRIFGCMAHVHVPSVRRTKLDDKSFIYVLLGVSEESKGYRLYDPIAKKIVVSRDVIFEEEKQWDWDVSYKDQILVDLKCGEDSETENDEEETERENIDENGEGETCESSATNGEEARVERTENEIGEGSKRVRFTPAWTEDYVSGEGFSGDENALSDDDEANMVLMVTDDPLCYEEAVKGAHWKEAMDCEIKSIEKNKT